VQVQMTVTTRLRNNLWNVKPYSLIHSLIIDERQMYGNTMSIRFTCHPYRRTDMAYRARFRPKAR